MMKAPIRQPAIQFVVVRARFSESPHPVTASPDKYKFVLAEKKALVIREAYHAHSNHWPSLGEIPGLATSNWETPDPTCELGAIGVRTIVRRSLRVKLSDRRVAGAGTTAQHALSLVAQPIKKAAASQKAAAFKNRECD